MELGKIMEDNVKRYNVKTNKLSNVNVKTVANTLVMKLNDEGSFKYFCKVAHSLPESVIWSNLEQAMTGRNPSAYFTFLCNLSLNK